MLETDLLTVESEAGALENDQLTAVLEVRDSARCRRVGMTQRVRRAALRAGALFRPLGRRVRAEHNVQRTEAGSDFAAQFCSCDPPMVHFELCQRHLACVTVSFQVTHFTEFIDT